MNAANGTATVAPTFIAIYSATSEDPVHRGVLLVSAPRTAEKGAP